MSTNDETLHYFSVFYQSVNLQKKPFKQLYLKQIYGLLILLKNNNKLQRLEYKIISIQET